MTEEERVIDEAVDDVSDDELSSVFTDMEEEEEEADAEEATEETAEEEPAEEEAAEEEAAEEEPPVDPIKEKKFSQEDLDRILGQSRIKGREYEEHAQALEQMTGMPLKDVTEYVRKQQVEKMVEETGLSEEEARRVVDDRQKVTQLEEKLQQLQQQQQVSQQIMGYNQEKSKFIKNPLAKKYEAAIDAFAQGGKVLGFEAAMKFVLGEKMLSGEITESIKSATQNKTLADVNKRSKAAPVSGAQTGGALSQAPKELRGLVKNFGMESDFKDIAEDWEKEQKRRRG